MAAQPQIGQQWTVEQYLAMERASTIRHEFVGGRVYAMSGGDQRHSSISINICAILADRLLDRPGNRCRVFNTDMKVRLANERDHLSPDASVTCDGRDLADDSADFIRYPSLVVEVLSPSTEQYDRGAKFELYRERGTLVAYVLVEARCQAVEVRSREDGGAWSVATHGPGEAIILRGLDLVVPVSSFYRGLTA